MNKLPYIAAVLLMVAGTAAAQPTNPGKLKIKTKKGREVAAPAPAAPVAATDWTLPYAASITADGLKQDLAVLASDAYEGRETGKKGQKMAADYIAKAFAADGLTGPVPGSDNAYLQHFDMDRSILEAPATTVKTGGKTYQGNKDFYAILGSAFSRPTVVQPVFVGYGIKDDKYSDFATAADYKDKDIIMLMGEPVNAKGQSLISADGKPSPYATADLPGIGGRQGSLFPLGARSIT